MSNIDMLKNIDAAKSILDCYRPFSDHVVIQLKDPVENLAKQLPVRHLDSINGPFPRFGFLRKSLHLFDF